MVDLFLFETITTACEEVSEVTRFGRALLAFFRCVLDVGQEL